MKRYIRASEDGGYNYRGFYIVETDEGVKLYQRGRLVDIYNGVWSAEDAADEILRDEEEYGDI